MINWSLMGPPPDIAGNFQQGVKMGQALVTRHRTENALRAYLSNPNGQALNALAVEDPDLAFRYARIEGEQAEAAARKAKAETEAAAIERKAQLGQTFLTDPQAARSAAIGGGDFDIAKEFDALDKPEQERSAAFFKVATPLAYDLLKIKDPAQRSAAFNAAKPVLLANGADPGMVEQFDVSNDAGLSAIVSMGETLASKIDRNTISYREVGPGARLVPFRDGVPLTNDTGAAPTAQPITSSETVSLGSIQAPPYAKQTSGYRDPQHNRNVGGVPNSYHTKKDAAGNPMARDFVPSGGQSMAQLEADLRSANPGMDVINEGDHVHVEPGNRSQANASNIRAKAQEAIAAGADPAAVKARAASMGVTL